MRAGRLALATGIDELWSAGAHDLDRSVGANIGRLEPEDGRDGRPVEDLQELGAAWVITTRGRPTAGFS